MAILKHKASKNASYSGVQDYLTYKHKENQETGHYVPILDEFGLLQERANCVLAYINGYGEEGNPDDWVPACMETNLRWHKNNVKQDVKQHQYIIAHPASDCALVTMEDLLEEGKEFARANLQGFDTLIAVHLDTNHYHVHCVSNSVRSVEREEQPWMLRNEDGNVVRCEVAAGGKHRDSNDFRRHCQEWLLDYTKSHGWTVKDNLSIENQRKAERQKDTKLELVNLLIGTASQCSSMPQLQTELKQQYQIDLVVRGHTCTLHLPNREKGIRLNKLDLTPEDLMRSMGLDQDSVNRINQAAGAKKEQQKYRQWIRQQRLKNAMQAEDLISTVEQRLSDMDSEEIDSVKYLIKQTTYAERDMNTELEKMKYIQDRWMDYLDSSDSRERNRCCGYIHWAGYDPDSRSELEELRTMIQMAEMQVENLQLNRFALTEIIPSCLSDLAESDPSKHTGPLHFSYEREIENDVTVQPDSMDYPSDSIQRADNPSEFLFPASSGNSPNNTWWTEPYKQARKYLYGSKTEKPQPELAYQLMQQEATMNNGLALHDLAKMHQTGLGCNQDQALAEKLFSDAYRAFLRKVPSEKNPAYLQYRIGKLLLQGLGVEQNHAAAAEWFEKSSAAGNPYAAYSFASLCNHGQGVELNEGKAFALYKIAASNTRTPNAYAAYELGNMYKTGRGTEKDAEASEQWYRKAYTGFLKLEQSTLDDTLLYRLGQMNAKGMGTDVDTAKAISYYEKAAKLKNTNALYGLGMLYINSSLAEYNPQKAITYLEEAAEAKNPFAQYQLGKLYLAGKHIIQDPHAAINLFTSAAESGNDMAMYQLGKLFYYGGQIQQDSPKAITYLEKASSHNNLPAMTLLGTIYLNEKSPQDQRKGVALLKKAAALNNPAAQYQLGKHFYYASRNRDQALSYLHMAAEQEYTGAMALLGKILITEGSHQDVEEGIDLLLRAKSQDNAGCKELLAEIRYNKKKFAEIASRYQSRADHLKYDSMHQSEAVRFRQMWHNQLEAERYLKKKIKEQRRDSRNTRSSQKETQHSR